MNHKTPEDEAEHLPPDDEHDEHEGDDDEGEVPPPVGPEPPGE